MTNKLQLTPDEINQRIIAGMSLVHDLYGEVTTLLNLVISGLVASDANVSLGKTRGFVLPRDKKGSKILGRFLKADLGFLAEIGGVSLDETGEPDDDEEMDSEDADEEAPKGKILITPDSKFLGVKAILFDAKAVKERKFTPSVQAAVFSGLRRLRNQDRAKQDLAEGTTFEVRANAVRRLVKEINVRSEKEINAGSTKGGGVSVKISGATLAATMSPTRVAPLASFSSEDVVSEFVETLVRMVDEAIGAKPG